MSEIKKCVVTVGGNDCVCGRNATTTYDCLVQVKDQIPIRQKLDICSRHKQVFEEFLETQNE